MSAKMAWLEADHGVSIGVVNGVVRGSLIKSVIKRMCICKHGQYSRSSYEHIKDLGKE